MDPMDIVNQIDFTGESSSNDPPAMMCEADMVVSLIGEHSRPGHASPIPISFDLTSSPHVGYVAYHVGYCDTSLCFPLSMFLLALLQALGVCYSQTPPQPAWGG